LVELGCTTYTLHAVVHHKGRSAVRGHYIATVRDQKKIQNESNNSKWFEFDDSIVSEQTDAEALDGFAKDTAYILFYIRDDIIADESKSK
jgi:ubiquitin C-terminal hydrolase